jgi:hypothetical protein
MTVAPSGIIAMASSAETAFMMGLHRQSRTGRPRLRPDIPVTLICIKDTATAIVTFDGGLGLTRQDTAARR